MSRSRLWSLDHKTIGVQFLISSLVMLLLGGLLAMAVRWQLAWPWTEMPIVGRALFGDHGRVMSPEGYTALFTMHGTVMIFFVIIPLLTGAFGNYLIPLMIGARDMAFPRLNAFSFWIMVPGIADAHATHGVGLVCRCHAAVHGTAGAHCSDCAAVLRSRLGHRLLL